MLRFIRAYWQFKKTLSQCVLFAPITVAPESVTIPLFLSKNLACQPFLIRCC
jgi:hypothetical protein